MDTVTVTDMIICTVKRRRANFKTGFGAMLRSSTLKLKIKDKSRPGNQQLGSVILRIQPLARFGYGSTLNLYS